MGRYTKHTDKSEIAKLVMKRSGTLRRFVFAPTARSIKEFPKAPSTLIKAQMRERTTATSLLNISLIRRYSSVSCDGEVAVEWLQLVWLKQSNELAVILLR